VPWLAGLLAFVPGAAELALVLVLCVVSCQRVSLLLQCVATGVGLPGSFSGCEWRSMQGARALHVL
jgi:hypothetical protein